jgi:c-di-GMP-binding flagellar brake protein YcgR
LSIPVDKPNLRQAARKILRFRALVRTGNGEIAQGKTMDISQGGVCIVLENPLPPGHLCEIRIDIFSTGKAFRFRQNHVL